MRLSIIIIGVLSSVFTSMAQGKLYLYSQNSEYGYRDKKGEVRITPGTYVCAYLTIKKPVLLQSAKDEFQWFIVDVLGRQLQQVYVVDGNPDRYSKGLIRVQKDGLVGFSDKKGRMVIAPRYVQVERFFGKYTVANKEAVSMDNSSTDKQIPVSWIGGKWGVIDRKGNEVIPFVYDRVWNEKDECFEYVNKNAIFVLTEKGKIVWRKRKSSYL